MQPARKQSKEIRRLSQYLRRAGPCGKMRAVRAAVAPVFLGSCTAWILAWAVSHPSGQFRPWHVNTCLHHWAGFLSWL